MPRATIVIPCFNEAARLQDAEFLAFAQTRSDIDFLFVNDGSIDRTGELLASLEKRKPERFRVCSFGFNRGKAEAVREGIRTALASDPAPSYVGFWDADLATPLDAIPRLAAVLDERPEVQMVFGARVKLLGRAIERKAVRHYPGRIFATLVSTLLGLPVYDSQCGAKMFRATDEVAALFAEPFVTRWIFDVEILARFLQARRSASDGEVADAIYEYPLEEWRDVPGSKLRFADFARSAADLLRIRRRYPLR
jgi:dolichyl-phosphate beta-glucosyltransferase